MNGIANPARVSEQLHARLQTIPGFREFCESVAPLAQYAATPGWQDDDGIHTQNGAKPIGLAQWGAAITTAGLVTEAVHGAPWPVPGVDPAGFIWLTWSFKGGAELALELHASLVGQTYKWTSMKGGMPHKHSSDSLRDVVESLRAVRTSAAA